MDLWKAEKEILKEEDKKMKKFLSLGVLLLFLLSSVVMGATTMTQPAKGEVLTLDANYEFGGTSGLSTPNCSVYYRHQGESTWTKIGSTTEGKLELNSTVPDSFGTNDFNFSCYNITYESDLSTGVSINRYASGEMSEVAIDIVILGGIAFLGFVNLFVVLYIVSVFRRKVK